VAYSLLLAAEAESPALVLPWVPIPRADLRLRAEALLLFRLAGLSERVLPCADDLGLEALVRIAERDDLRQLRNLRLTLVDSDGAWLPSSLRRLIVEVLDHHPGALRPAEAPGAVFTVEPVGSTCTLVAEQICERRPELMTPQIAVLLLGPILLDTVDFDPAAQRGTAKDRRLADRLRAVAGGRAAGLYPRLLAARQELPGLGTPELLRRDYKAWAAGGVRFGISSCPVSLGRWRERDSDLEAGIAEYREAQELDLLLVMIAYDEPGAGGFRRELGISAAEPPGVERTARALQDQGLELRDLPSGGRGVRWFRQEAVAVSRKRLVPLLCGWLESEGLR
jgi:exopolyphosphatase